MEDFDERVQAYFEKLRSNPGLLENIMKNTKDEKTLDILLLPSNEMELKLANVMFDVMGDILKIVEDAYYGDLKHVDPNDCRVINIYADVINAIRKGDYARLEAIKDNLCNKITSKEAARIVYEMIVVFAQDAEEAVETIARKCDIDLDDDLSVKQFELLMKKANEIVNTANDNLDINNINMNNDSQVKNAIEYCEELHRLYEENLSNNISRRFRPNF